MMKKIMSSPVNPLNINDESQSSDTHFMQDLLRMVPPEDVEMVNQIQRKMMNRFEKTNEMLVNCNALAQGHYEKLCKDYRQHTQKLVEMHKDLDSIFHRIKTIKQKLKAKYPQLAKESPTFSTEEEFPETPAEE